MLCTVVTATGGAHRHHPCVADTRRVRTHASASSSASSDEVKRTVANDPSLWREAWFACENPQALRVLAVMPVAKVDARRIGQVDTKTKEWISGGATSGILAAQRGDVAFIRELARIAGVKHFEIGDDDGRRALHHAAAYGKTDAVRALVELGCDIDAVDDCDGSTACILSACFERRETLDALLDLGADVRISDRGNATIGGHLAQRAPRMNAQLLRALVIAGPGGTSSLRRGEKTYLAKRAALKNQLTSLRLEDLVQLAKSWRANVRGTDVASDKGKLIDALLATTL